MIAIPGYLLSPPEGCVEPPVATRLQVLPFGQVTWRDFERLCLGLAVLEGEVEHCQLYGEPGQQQQGIDIYSRLAGGGDYVVYQCRRVEELAPGDIRRAVDDFLGGEWAGRAGAFVLCTSARVAPTSLAEAVEEQAQRLSELDKRFEAWDADGLSRRLKDLPQVVDDFFGREWVRVFCGDEAADALGSRLDVAEVQRLRYELGRFYGNLFAGHDAAALLDLAESDLCERFVAPNVVEQREHFGDGRQADAAEPPEQLTAEIPPALSDGRRPGRLRYKQRLPLEQWLARSKRHVLLGDPGSGKSSALRFLALDILADAPRFSEVARRWRGLLPVWVPFAFWVGEVAQGAPNRSLSAALGRWLRSFDEERLWPIVERALDDERLVLLVDGLDEWSDRDAAGVVFDQLRVFAAQRDVPLVVSSRPAGLERLGPAPHGWSVAALAPLTLRQQQELISLAPFAAVGETREEPAGTRQDAGRFFLELARAPDLTGLASVPLLLLLLFWLHWRGTCLPTSRFAVYGELVEYLIEEHPGRRRRAAAVVQPVAARLTTEETMSALAALAFALQQKGTVSLPQAEAERALRDHLEDNELGLGLPAGDGHRAASQLAADAGDVFGLLVEFAPGTLGFFHRSVQEHLAAVHVSRLGFERQLELVRAHGAKPHWREAVLSLLFLSSKENDTNSVDRLVEAVQASAAGPVERLRLPPLLTEIAVGPFACSDGLARGLAAEGIAVVECGSSPAIREAVATRLLDGLDSAPVRPLLVEHMATWLPGLEEHRVGVFEAMEHWPAEPETETAIWRGLFDEETANARAAGRAYAVRCRSNESAARALVDLLGRPLRPQTRAVALEALAGGWPDHPALAGQIAAALDSVDPDIRLVARTFRVRRGEHTEDDLDDLLELGSQWIDVDYDRQEDVGVALRNGWPGSEEIKKRCLDVSRRDNPDRSLRRELALWLLLAGYPRDPDVVEYCRREILEQKYPFLMLNPYRGWELLPANFRDEPTIVAALDEWLPDQKHNYVEVAYASLVGRTERGKEKLIEMLADARFPDWPTRALVEGWGMDDPAAAQALKEAAEGPAPLAGSIARYLPRILGHGDRLRERLLALVSDPENDRPGLALRALAELGDHQLGERAVTAALTREPRTLFSQQDELHLALIEHFARDPRVRPLVTAAYQGETATIAAVARAYADDPEIRALVRRRATPLPAHLRTLVATRLGEGAGDAAYAVELLDGFLDDADGTAAAAAGQAWVRRRRETDNPDEEKAVARAERGLHAQGPSHESTQQAALAVLFELGRLDVFAAATEQNRPEEAISVALTDYFQPNLVLARIVVEHWDKAERALGQLPAQRLTGFLIEMAFWNVISLFADQSPTARGATLSYTKTSKYVTANLLRFFAAAHPRSDALFELCLRAVRGVIVDSSPSRDLIVTGAQLLGEHFGDDPRARERIVAAELPGTSLVLTLAEGWPESDELHAIVEELEQTQTLPPLEVLVRARMAAAPSELAYQTLRRLIERIEQNPLREEYGIDVIAKRIQRDPELATRLENTLASGEARPSELASFPRLLASSGQLSDQARTGCEELLSRAIEGDLTHIVALDLVAGERRPLAFALLDALGSTPTDPATTATRHHIPTG